MPGSSRKAMKVVIINTHYVETDATSFKSVVQKLTGKDSTLANDQEESDSGNILRERRERMNRSSSAQMLRGKKVILMRDSSFKEFDRLLREMPPMHEL